MKKILLSLLAGGTLVITSCSSDPCKDKSAITLCNNNGTLVSNGSNCDCACNAGYSGASCNTVDITTAIGNWNQVSTALLGTATNARTGNTKVEADGGSVSRVKITNLNQFFGCTNGGATSDIVCYANFSNGELVLEETAQCGHIFKGKGVKQTDNSWKFNYTTAVGSQTYNCETTLRK